MKKIKTLIILMLAVLTMSASFIPVSAATKTYTVTIVDGMFTKSKKDDKKKTFKVKSGKALTAKQIKEVESWRSKNFNAIVSKRNKKSKHTGDEFKKMYKSSVAKNALTKKVTKNTTISVKYEQTHVCIRCYDTVATTNKVFHRTYLKKGEPFKSLGVSNIPQHKGYIFNRATSSFVNGDKLNKKTPYTAKFLYTPIKYTIEYVGNGASGYMTPQNGCKYTDKITLKNCGFSAKYKKFTGWYCDSNKMIYRPGQAVSGLTENNGGVVKMYAQWENAKYVVEFDGNGATGLPPDMIVGTIGQPITLPKNTFNGSGHKFKFWINSKGYGRWTPGTKVDLYSKDFMVMDGKDHYTLYAYWE